MEHFLDFCYKFIKKVRLNISREEGRDLQCWIQLDISADIVILSGCVKGQDEREELAKYVMPAVCVCVCYLAGEMSLWV